jgi:glycosidase
MNPRNQRNPLLNLPPREEKMKRKFLGALGFAFAAVFSWQNLFAQPDSVDVTFYYKPSGNPAAVFLPGEFNNWGQPYSNGQIVRQDIAMQKDALTGIWRKTVRLRVGGPASGGLVSGAYQYKFNENGGTWLSDPLNPRQNPRDNNNSYLFIRNPTIHYLLPNTVPSVAGSGVVKARQPLISAYIFASTRTGVDTASIVVKLDNLEYKNIGAGYDAVTKKFTFVPPQPLSNGSHQLILTVKSSANTAGADTTRFTVQADPVQILTQPAETWKTSWPIRGEILKANGTPDSTLRAATLQRGATNWAITVRNGKFDTTMSLLEGDNIFSVRALVGGATETSQTIRVVRKVNHAPLAVIAFDTSGTQLTLRANQSNDPDGQSLSFSWQEDPANPRSLGINGATNAVVTAAKPQTPGEYYFTLTARDPDGNVDLTRQYFTLAQSGQVIPATIKSNPAWAKQARVYEIFIHSFTPEGTLKAAANRLSYIQAMGFNVVWLMPIMDNNFAITGVGAGYDIVDFYRVAPEFGTNNDFLAFVDRAHQLGMRVVLDVTPNHTSQAHPFAADVRAYREHSRYWNFYQHDLISNGSYRPNLPERRSNNGLFVYYDGFSEEIINYNWGDLDARLYMTEVYKFWINEMRADGFRFDVYWGPARRANNGNGGENEMGVPVREALKHVKPDIWLLAEDSGVGFGTERIYADGNGGVDSGYDWPLYFDGFRAGNILTNNASRIHDKIFNNNFYPGPNSYFFRFLENHDETRLALLAGSIQQTMPHAATLFTAPGIPMVYAGQEVGFGNGLGDFEGKRGKVNFDDPDKSVVQKFYQKLCHVRAKFPAFRTQRLIRLNQANTDVYVFSRPLADENAVVAVNFGSATRNVTVTLNASTVEFSGGITPGKSMVLSELLAGVANTITADASGSATFSLNLPAYGAAVYIVANEPKAITVPDIPTRVEANKEASIPQQFTLHQNFPNPFNPETTIHFALPQPAEVTLRVFNLLGEEVITLARGKMAAGTHTLAWNGRNAAGELMGSGIYLLRLEAGQEVAVKKMALVR